VPIPMITAIKALKYRSKYMGSVNISIEGHIGRRMEYKKSISYLPLHLQPNNTGRISEGRTVNAKTSGSVHQNHDNFLDAEEESR